MRHAAQYEIRGAASDADLRGILALQAANLPEALDSGERRAQGFVTLRHDLALLREMNEPYAHVIATPAGTNEVAAYALVMLPRFRGRLPLIDPLFDELDRLEYRGRPVRDYRHYVMGQVCVGSAHRGRGLVERLYAEHRTRMAPHFDLMITDIDCRNTRSVRAHEKAGFEFVREFRTDGGEEWEIVVLDLRRGG